MFFFNKRESVDRAPKYLYSFEPIGYTYKCKIGKIPRQDSIDKSRKGDPVTLTVYQYKGQNAYAVVNDRTGCDIGVVPADLIRILEKKNKVSIDGLHGKITDIFKTDDEISYLKQCTVEIYK